MDEIVVTAKRLRRINQAGLDLIKSFEGLELKAYLCPAKVWTIGYGSTGKHVTPGMVITEAQAEDLLRDDLARFEAAAVKYCEPATDNQFAALVSFAFNVGEGEGGLKTSTLRLLHQAGDYAGAKAQFARWNKARGKVLAGLTRRRSVEATLYGKTS